MLKAISTVDEVAPRRERKQPAPVHSWDPSSSTPAPTTHWTRRLSGRGGGNAVGRVRSPGASSNSREILWLARAIRSETDRPSEQRLVAWTLRNRVETGYRGSGSYQEAVLDPYQYSAFNRGSASRRQYTGLNERSQYPGWQAALRIAREVYSADASARPFPRTTRHFYSPRSMSPPGSAPSWADEDKRVHVRGIDPNRFRFYRDIA